MFLLIRKEKKSNMVINNDLRLFRKKGKNKKIVVTHLVCKVGWYTQRKLLWIYVYRSIYKNYSLRVCRQYAKVEDLLNYETNKCYIYC